MRPRPRWPPGAAPSPATSRTPKRCCASSATTSAPPTARPPATSSFRSPRRRSTTPRSPKAGPAWAGLGEAARDAWSAALALGEEHGYRNAQVSVVAPTGTIGLVMDCDTTGIEPDFALVKFKKLAGGGYFKIINRAVPDALRALGYDEKRDRGHRSPTRSAARRSPTRRAINHAALARQGPAGGGDRQGRGGAARRLRHPLRLQQMDARRRDAERRAEDPGRALRGAGLRPPARRSASPRPRSTPPTFMPAAP